MKRTTIITLLLVVSILTASFSGTVAWFTDSVSTARNTIQSGNLDLEVEYSTDGEKWENLEGASDVFNNEALWEPGHTEAVALKIENNGSLTLKYDLAVNVYKEIAGTNVYGQEFKLSDYLEVRHSAVQQDGAIGGIY